MILNGLEIPGNSREVATFKRNGGNLAPEWWQPSSGMRGNHAPE